MAVSGNLNTSALGATLWSPSTDRLWSPNTDMCVAARSARRSGGAERSKASSHTGPEHFGANPITGLAMFRNRLVLHSVDSPISALEEYGGRLLGNKIILRLHLTKLIN